MAGEAQTLHDALSPARESPIPVDANLVDAPERQSHQALLEADAGTSVVTFSLSAEEAQALHEALCPVALRGYQQNPSAREGPGPVDSNLVDDFERQSHQALLAADVKPLVNIGSLLASHDVVLIKGVNFGSVAPTTEARALHGSVHPEALIAGVTKQLACKLVGFMDQEKLNTHLLFHDIRALPSGREGANGGGMLGMHMDMGFRPDIRPNFLMLACLREGTDLEVKTPLVSSKALYEGIVQRFPEDLPVFRNPQNWNIISPATSGSYRVETPLLTGDEQDPVFHCRLDRMFPLNARASQALQHLHDTIADRERGFHLECGDLLVVNNHKVLHRRTKFRASYDQHDRLLMRAYAKAAETVPQDRIYPMREDSWQQAVGASSMSKL